MKEGSKESVEIIVMWNRIVQRVDHMPLGDEGFSNFTVGEDPDADFPMPSDLLGGASMLELVRCDGENVSFAVTKSARGDITYQDGKRRTLGELVPMHGLVDEDGVERSCSLEIEKDQKVKITMGSFVFLIKRTNMETVLPISFRMDKRSVAFTAGSLIFHLAIIGLVFFMPPDKKVLAFEQQVQKNRYLDIIIAPALRPKPEVKIVDKDTGKTTGASDKSTGRVRRNNTRPGPKIASRPSARDSSGMARDLKRQIANGRRGIQGINSFIVGVGGAIAAFGPGNGEVAESALDALIGTGPAGVFGNGIMGPSGTGVYNAGDGTGGIKSGPLRIGGNSGPPIGTGRKLTERTKKGIVKPPKKIVYKGSISKEAIRREIMRHTNEIKHCYNKALVSRPDLSGRVVVRFMIARTGAVQLALMESSTLGSNQVEQCIVRAVKRWNFPQPEDGGVAMVTYPFMLLAP